MKTLFIIPPRVGVLVIKCNHGERNVIDEAIRSCKMRATYNRVFHSPVLRNDLQLALVLIFILAGILRACTEIIIEARTRAFFGVKGLGMRSRISNGIP